MKKTKIYILIFTLLSSLFLMNPTISLANDLEMELVDEKAFIVSDEEHDTVDFYKDAQAENLLLTIPTHTDITLISYSEEVDSDYVFVRFDYTDDEQNVTEVEGYVNKKHISFYIDEGQELIDETVNESIFEDEQEEMDAHQITEDMDTKVAGVTVKGIVESKTSKLGHIRNANVLIYETIGGTSFAAGSKYTHAVYYIKQQAVIGSDIYYLISTEPSAVKGVIGWVKLDDISTNTHTGVDKQTKVFYFNGNGKATTKAWGGHQDTVYPSLSHLKDQAFHVHLTEKVGNNTWYRGNLNGKTVWLHSNYLYDTEYSKTSKLGHVKNKNVRIYKTINGESVVAGSRYIDAVYYIKEQALSKNETYYLISTQPSSTKGVVGWVNSKDISIHNHAGVDKKSKRLYVKGNGKATTKAWGGHKDSVFPDLILYRDRPFDVNLTEKVGNNIWYRGVLNGKTVWLHSNYLYELEPETEVEIELDYDRKGTSLLGHLQNNQVKIYYTIGERSISASTKYTNKVYYIKSQTEIDNQLYYLISTEPSAEKGIVGWVKASDVSIHTHAGLDKERKTFYINGNGKATSKAWGGSKDNVFASLTQYKGYKFEVNLTEKVGNNIWYRGKLAGKTVWVHSSSVRNKQHLIVLDAGHGGADPGSSGNGLVEKNLNLDITLRTQKLLEAAGFTVIMTRTKDETLSLHERTNIANKSGADLFLSIHINSFTTTSPNGIETWHMSKGPEAQKSKILAESIQNAVIDETKTNSRGVKDGNLHINRESKIPSSLIEIGFITNKNDSNNLKNDTFKQKVAKGIVAGITKYFQIMS